MSKYPNKWIDCTNKDFNTCIECYHWDECELKEFNRKGNLIGATMLLMSVVFVIMVLLFFVGVI